MILRLTLLAPDIVEATSMGGSRQFDDLLKGFPPDWDGQRAVISA